jgi:hypothetical protein
MLLREGNVYVAGNTLDVSITLRDCTQVNSVTLGGVDLRAGLI